MWIWVPRPAVDSVVVVAGLLLVLGLIGGLSAILGWLGKRLAI